jgi:hypothetical protein
MAVVNSKKSSSKKSVKAKPKLSKKKNPTIGLARSFGSLKRGLYGLAYQKEARNEWEDFSSKFERYKELTSKFKVSQKEVDSLANEINKKWRTKNRKRLTKKST